MTTTRIVLACALLLLASCASQVELQGHRGARGLLPENTLPAFAKALDLGVDVLELDTQVTKDGVVLISHDPCLNVELARDKDGAWLAPATKKGPCVLNLTFAELQQYDVGRIRPDSAYAKTFAAQQAVDGTRMPTLRELFALVKKSGNTRVKFNIETKLSPFLRDETIAPEALVDAVLGAITEANMLDRVTIQSFDWRTLKIVQQKFPDVPLVYLSAQQKWLDNINAGNREGSAWTAGLNASDFGGSVPRMVKVAGGAVWSPHFGDLDEAKIKEAHALGLKVIVWTVNNAKDIQRMLDLGVDGIISDYPDRAAEVMRHAGKR